MIYSFWLFDKHCQCIYLKKWHEGNSLHKMTAEDDAKLVFGVIFSLKNTVRKLAPDDQFLGYTTSTYKLHYYETPTNLKFVFITDPGMDNLRVVLHQIHVSLYVEYVVKNPLVPAKREPGWPIDVELFNLALDQFVKTLDKV